MIRPPSRAGEAAAVLHLIDTGGPGGAETIFAQLAERMGTFTRTVAVVPREDWLATRLRESGIQPFVLPAKGSFNVRYLRSLIQIIRRNDIRLIHTHLLGSAVYGALLGRLSGAKVLSVLHGPTDLKHPGRLPRLKAHLLRRYCARIVAVSNSTREALTSFGIPNRLSVLIENGIDTELYTPGRSHGLRTELGLTDHDLLIGAVGNIRRPKAYGDLIDAAAGAIRQRGGAHLAIVGQGDDQALAGLRARAASHGIDDRVHLIGFRRASPDLYRNFDLFVSSSYSEGLSLAFLEAMSVGLPIVATRSGGPQEVLEDGHSGLLVPVSSPQMLSSAMNLAIDDRALRVRLGATARARVIAKYSLESTLSRYEALYAELLDTVSREPARGSPYPRPQ